MRIKICGLGRRMLQLFCGTTVLASVYLLLGFFGCYEKWFRGPAGIGKEPVYWLLRLGIVILVENIIFLILKMHKLIDFCYFLTPNSHIIKCFKVCIHNFFN